MSVYIHQPDEVFGSAGYVRDLLADLTVVGPPAGPLNGAKVQLFKNDIQPDDDTLLADLTEADFDGYAAGTVTWGTGDTDDQGRAVLIGNGVLFSATGSVTPNTIYGWALVNAAETELIAAERFPTPVSVADVGDVIHIPPVFRVLVS